MCEPAPELALAAPELAPELAELALLLPPLLLWDAPPELALLAPPWNEPPLVPPL